VSFTVGDSVDYLIGTVNRFFIFFAKKVDLEIPRTGQEKKSEKFFQKKLDKSKARRLK
jgi:hypothetical protein